MKIGFFGLLTVALIVLKLTGVISLGWGMIALVFFVPAILVFTSIFVLAALGGLQ